MSNNDGTIFYQIQAALSLARLHNRVLYRLVNQLPADDSDLRDLSEAENVFNNFNILTPDDGEPDENMNALTSLIK